MFPRRAYHDAIYEEEYGSESEEECCRGRGLSAILCWFLSVIILVGLAASVVLTVFFILRSRSFLTKNNAEDVNVVFDHGNGFKIVPTLPVDDHFDFTASSKSPFGQNGQDEGSRSTSIEATAARTTSHITTATTVTTKLPTTSRMTTRKYYSDTTGGPHETLDKERTTPLPPVTTSESMFKFLFDTIKTFQKDESPRSNESVEKTTIDEELLSNESSDRGHNVPSPSPVNPSRRSSVQTTVKTTVTPVLFTLPPSTSTISQTSNKRNSTKNPERTSFSSEEVTVSPYQQYDHGKHYIPPPRSSSEEEGRVTSSSSDDGDITATTEKTPTTIDGPTGDDVKYQVEESKKLTKMLNRMGKDSWMEINDDEDFMPGSSHRSSTSCKRTSNDNGKGKEEKKRRSDNNNKNSDVKSPGLRKVFKLKKEEFEIPPHGQNGELTTTTTPHPTTVITEDLLAKIIKNLQPKWNKSKIESTTVNTKFDHSATSTRIRNRYVEKDRRGDSSKEGKDEVNVKIVKRIKYRGPPTTTPSPQPSTVIFITPDNTMTTESPPATLRPALSFPGSSKQQPSGTASSSSFTNVKAPTRILNNYHGGQPIEIVKGPDFSQNGRKSNQQQLKEHSEYFDVLVGSDDHKTLVTKETEAGIITSAILPPWFDTSGNSTDTMELSNQTLKFTKNHHGTSSDDDSTNDHSKPKSDIDILLNLFSNSPLPKKTNRTGQMSKSEKGGSSQGQQQQKQKHQHREHEMTAEESKKSLHLKNLEEQLKPFFSSPSESSDPGASNGPQQQQHVQPANNAFHFGSSDGTTNIYGYYPEDDLEEGESVDQVDIDVIGHGQYPPTPTQKRVSDNKEKQRSESDPTAPSHVIDIAYDPKARPEIVIEPDVADDAAEDEGDEDDDDIEEYLEHVDNKNHQHTNRRRHNSNINYPPELTETMTAAGSDTQNQVVVPPPGNMMTPSIPTINRRVSLNSGGSGIRRPMTSSEEKEDQAMAGSQPQQQVDWSLKSTTTNTENNVKSDSRVGESMTQQEEEDEEDNLTKDPINNNHESLISEEEQDHQEPIVDKLLQVDSSTGENHILRKPINDIDETLYPPSKETQDVNELVGTTTTTTTTTTKPRVNVYEVYSEPYRPQPSIDSSRETDAKTTGKPLLISSGEDQTENNITSGGGFTPPELLNFHDNTYTFNSQASSSEYISKDGWRPVIHNDHSSTERHHRPGGKGNPGLHPNSQQHNKGGDRGNNNYYLSTSVQPPFGPPLEPHGTTVVISSTSSTPLNLQNPNVGGQRPPTEYDEEEDENEEEDNNPTNSNNDWYSTSSSGQSQQQQQQQQHNHVDNNKGKLKIKPSMLLPASLTHNMNQNLMSPPSRVKFPDNSEGQRLQQFHHQQQQHLQQHSQQLQNNLIDRTKYMHRPAPPRIVMRRTPQFNFPFNPNRKRNTQTNGPPPMSSHRNFPRIGTQQQQQSSPSYPPPMSSPSSSGPFSSPEPPSQAEVHSSNLLQNNKLMRHRHERFKNSQQQTSAPGAVHWPDDNYGRNHNNNIHPANRRPITVG